MWTRRKLLKVGGASLVLPFLPMFRGSARAQSIPGGPKRLVIVHYPQGNVMPQWVPSGDEHDFTLPYISAALERHRDRLLFISGVDNRMPNRNDVGNAHFNANYTVFTGRPFLEQDNSRLSPAGPSIEQVVAETLAGQTPFPRLDFAVGGQQNNNGLLNANEGQFFWYGPRDPVAAYNNPNAALLRLFGDNNVPPEDAWAQRARRSSVLNGVLDNFSALRRRLPAEDIAALDAHEDKLRQLESRIANGVGECNAPNFTFPPGYDARLDDDVSTPIFNQLLTAVLSCDLTRVVTLNFANGNSPEFPWLNARNGGPIVDLNLFENWHSMVHADFQDGMEHAFRWYHEMFADLLDLMAAAQDADGDNLLDTSLVVFMSEYSSGRHHHNALPVILAGNLPGAQMGRWVNHLSVSAEQLGPSDLSGTTTNQLWTSVLHAFGRDDETFGLRADDLPTGPLPGLII